MCGKLMRSQQYLHKVFIYPYSSEKMVEVSRACGRGRRQVALKLREAFVGMAKAEDYSRSTRCRCNAVI